AAECSSGFCADGRCCDSVCDGQCEACDIANAEGSCSAVLGAPHGNRPPCASGSAQNACSSAACDGVKKTSCENFVGASVACRAASCTEGIQTLAAACDGKGACPAAITKSCAPYVCDVSSCKTSCATDSDCAVGSGHCDKGACVLTATCDGD